MIPLETLLVIWFFLWALLWAIYFLLDGFDLGMATLMPFVAKTEEEKRIVYNSAGPFWDGNEVWLITAGGVTFAAFPTAYAVMFSALYAPLLLLLFALIFRAVALDFRRKIDDPKWRKICDITLIISSFVPALLLGVAFANLFMGIPVDADGVYHGNLFMLLNPYGLAGGVLFVLIFCLHGALWLNFKAPQGALVERSMNIAKLLWWLILALIAVFLAMTSAYTEILSNINKMPVIYVFLVLAVLSFLGLKFNIDSEKHIYPWLFSAAFILCLTLFMVMGMYPGIIISSMDPAFSVTVFNGASSHLTLQIMFIVTILSVPIVVCYQIWVYYVFSHKITPEELASDHAY